MTERRIVLVGATGAFGSRLAILLSRRADTVLILAGRSLPALQALMTALRDHGAAATIDIAPFDRSRPDGLSAMVPWLVIDAAGPFQGSAYGLARAALACGAHYLDLADGRAFVAGFAAAVGEAAIAAERIAITGASSTPALSQAALTRLVTGWRQLDTVLVAISPGARAPRGLSVVSAILSYAGQPVRVFDDGRWAGDYGWSGLHRRVFPEIGARLLSLCETPDLDLLPARFPIRRRALFLAGLELTPLHLGLWMLGLPVRWRWLASLAPLAPLVRRVADLVAFLGTDRGGMIVEASGRDEEDRPIAARWALWATANAGPTVPVAAASALVDALAAGRLTAVGAQPCVGLLTLDEIMGALAGLPVATRIDEGHPTSPALFRRLIGRRFALLPPPVAALHDRAGAAAFTGQAVARQGRSLPARLLGKILGLPPSGHYAIRVEIVPDRRGETWTRTFGEHRFGSRLQDTPVLGRFQERFGPLRFAFDLESGREGMRWRFAGWSLLGLPLPRGAAPRMRASVAADDEQYRFSVVVALPLVGLLFAYRGKLDVL